MKIVKRLMLPKGPRSSVDLDMACVAARADMPPVQRSTANNHTKRKYANIDDVLIAIEDVLTKYQLTVYHKRVWKNDKEFFYTVIKHAPTGQYRSEMRPYIPDSGKMMTAIQQQGSAETYMRRYALNNLLCLRAGDLDDDGNYSKDTEDRKPIKEVTLDDVLQIMAEFDDPKQLADNFCTLYKVNSLAALTNDQRIKIIKELETW